MDDWFYKIVEERGEGVAAGAAVVGVASLRAPVRGSHGCVVA
jgi:hypothetical protein